MNGKYNRMLSGERETQCDVMLAGGNTRSRREDYSTGIEVVDDD